MNKINVSVFDELVRNTYVAIGRKQLSLQVKTFNLKELQDGIFEYITNQMNDLLTEEKQRNLIISDGFNYVEMDNSICLLSVQIMASLCVASAIMTDILSLKNISDRPFSYGLPNKISLCHVTENHEGRKIAIRNRKEDSVKFKVGILMDGGERPSFLLSDISMN